jgi:hypothetical protein
MYGFYDPAAAGYSEPFNPAFITWFKNLRGARAQAFNAYRQQRDPQGMFCNPYVAALIGA